MRHKALALVRRMDWLRGLRAAVALCGPLVLGDITGNANLGWAALGGFEAILSDIGGPYRTRLASLTTLSLGGAAGLFLGFVSGGHLATAIPATLLWCFLWSYLAVLGQPFSSAGVLVQVIFICGVGTPSDGHAALVSSLHLLAGGAWAALLSLFLWPVDAYRPARAALAECYKELASFLGSVTDLASREKQSAALWHRIAQHHQFRIRRTVETGWHVVANIRAERYADTPRGRQFIVLLEHADLLIARTVALAEHLEADAVAGKTSCAEIGLSGLDRIRKAELEVASLLTRRRFGSREAAREIQARVEQIPHSLGDCADVQSSSTRFLFSQIVAADSLLESSIEAAALVRLGGTAAPRSGRGQSTGHFGYVVQRLGSMRLRFSLEPILANFNAQSLTLRHAARVAIVCALDIGLVLSLHINHGYWLMLTSLIVLQPHVSGTLRRGIERIGGTIAGGILAALFAVTLHSQLATAALLFPLALLSLAILPVSYAAFAFFLTPTFVLAWLPYSGDWQLAVIRILDTFAGAILSILAMLFLFPIYERDRARRFLAASLAADLRYLSILADSWQTSSRQTRQLAEARRATGLAHNDTEESLERLLAETWPRQAPFARFATAFVTYLRRIAQSTTTLVALEGETQWKNSPSVRFRVDLVLRRLAWLEQQAATPFPLEQPWPEADEGSPVTETANRPRHPGERVLDRLERQTIVLYRNFLSLPERGPAGYVSAAHLTPSPRSSSPHVQATPSVTRKDLQTHAPLRPITGKIVCTVSRSARIPAGAAFSFSG